MAWRPARSLVVLRNEIEVVAPGTTVWTIGDEDHQDEPSDHNPNADGVVCAADILGDGGLDLARLAELVRTGGHPAAKYVIYRDRIASRSRGWVWRSYGGAFHSHVHVSVGTGPDGRSTGPYDDTSPWGLLDEEDQVDRADVFRVWNTDGVVRAPQGYDAEENSHWTAANVLRSAHLYSRLGADRAREMLALMRAAAGQDLAGAVRDTIRDEFNQLGPALAAELTEVPAEQVEQALRTVLGSLDEEA